MLSGELRDLVREVLREELAAIRTGGMTTPMPQRREEQVRINNDADLKDFVARILGLAKDNGSRAEIESGRWVFRLSNDVVMRSAPSGPEKTGVQFAKGLVGERQVTSLGAEIRKIRVGKRVSFTPLALDELRRRGIKIERSDA